MISKRSQAAVSDVVAERVFQRADGKEVRALVARPREVTEVDGVKIDAIWECDFQIVGVGDDTVQSAGGADSLQALQMALAMMATYLEGYQPEHGLTLDGDAELMLMKPDLEDLAKRLRTRPDYPDWGPEQ